MNNIIVHNESYYEGGGIYCIQCSPEIMNNTITRNLAWPSGSGLCVVSSSPVITNTILWGNYLDQISVYSGSPVISYCDVEDGWEGDGNIDIDPLFRDPDNGDFHLMSTACGDPYDSPCIDAGDPSIFDYLLHCDWGLGGQRSDMGAYGGQAIPTDIREEPEPETPMACGLLQNYPNPFNATTRLSYMLPDPGPASIHIYNLLGQHVDTVFEGEQQAGRHSLIWDAGHLPSGVYFARLEAEEYSQSIKMVLLK
jgi:hypothetical protein